VHVAERESLGHAGDSLKHGWHGYRGLWLRVYAPGKIRVSDPIFLHPARESEAGKIWPVAPFISNFIAMSWMRQVSKTLTDRCIRWAAESSPVVEKITHEEICKDPVNCPSNPALHGQPAVHGAVSSTWSRVLTTVDRLQHGGAIVVLPTAEHSALSAINAVCRVDCLNLGDSILDFWKSCIGIRLATDQRARDKATTEWNVKRNAVRSSATSIGYLAQADGCVIIDRGMRALGFGGKILVDDTVLRLDRKLVGLSEHQLLSNFGTRHGSAFRLCKAFDDVMVFVISQDGDLRLFASDGDQVHF
jgi:hypothetical protein